MAALPYYEAQAKERQGTRTDIIYASIDNVSDQSEPQGKSTLMSGKAADLQSDQSNIPVNSQESAQLAAEKFGVGGQTVSRAKGLRMSVVT